MLFSRSIPLPESAGRRDTSPAVLSGKFDFAFAIGLLIARSFFEANMNTLDSLPRELQSRILTIANDVTSLSAASMTCRTLHDTAAQHVWPKKRSAELSGVWHSEMIRDGDGRPFLLSHLPKLNHVFSHISHLCLSSGLPLHFRFGSYQASIPKPRDHNFAYAMNMCESHGCFTTTNCLECVEAEAQIIGKRRAMTLISHFSEFPFQHLSSLHLAGECLASSLAPLLISHCAERLQCLYLTFNQPFHAVADRQTQFHDWKVESSILEMNLWQSVGICYNLRKLYLDTRYAVEPQCNLDHAFFHLVSVTQLTSLTCVGDYYDIAKTMLPFLLCPNLTHLQLLEFSHCYRSAVYRDLYFASSVTHLMFSRVFAFSDTAAVLREFPNVRHITMTQQQGESLLAMIYVLGVQLSKSKIAKHLTIENRCEDLNLVRRADKLNPCYWLVKNADHQILEGILQNIFSQLDTDWKFSFGTSSLRVVLVKQSEPNFRCAVRLPIDELC